MVHLLGLILDPHEGESVYDLACGTGGMLLECVDHLSEAKEDYRTLTLYGQEKNLTSSSIARMNKFLHGIEDFQDVANYVKVASLEDIDENDYNLNIPLYVEKIIEDNLPSVEEALTDLKKAWKESQKAESKFKSILNKFTTEGTE